MHLDDCLSDESRSKECPEWNEEMAACDTGKVKQRIGNLHGYIHTCTCTCTCIEQIAQLYVVHNRQAQVYTCAHLHNCRALSNMRLCITKLVIEARGPLALLIKGVATAILCCYITDLLRHRAVYQKSLLSPLVCVRPS